MKFLITGVAGFIGMHVAKNILAGNHEVFGIDNLSNYYDVSLKNDRLKILQKYENFAFFHGDIANQQDVFKIFKEQRPEIVVNLAAQAGVRYSLEHPLSYIQSNVVGFTNILEACRSFEIKHLIYASSSSVYGLNETTPFNERDPTNHPVSLYGASKKSNELLAHSYSHLFGLPTTGLRFFTVYGPWGRPDMALFKFVKSIIADEKIQVYNKGNHIRDFTYIDDIVNGILAVTACPTKPDPNWTAVEPNPSTSSAPWKIYNIGNSNPINLHDFIAHIEKALQKKAILEYCPMQPGDVVATHADVKLLEADFEFKPKIGYREGIERFARWYREYYKIG